MGDSGSGHAVPLTELRIDIFEVLFSDKRGHLLLEIDAGRMSQALVKGKRLHPAIERFGIFFLHLVEQSLPAQDRA